MVTFNPPRFEVVFVLLLFFSLTTTVTLFLFSLSTILGYAATDRPSAAGPSKDDFLAKHRPSKCLGCFNSSFATLSHPNPGLCSLPLSPWSPAPVPELVVMITTSLDGLDYRRAIRSTWASVSRNNTGLVRYVFLLGTGGDGNVSEDVMAESARYGDMLVLDFVDSYGNLTYKTLAGMRWIVTHCELTKYFLKTDQDVYVFPERVLKLTRRREATLTNSLGGLCYRNSKPYRNKGHKYFTSISYYPYPRYPTFCSGTGYVSTLDVARRIVRASPDVPFFHLEDVYVALVAQELGISKLAMPGFAVKMKACKLGRKPTRKGEVYTMHSVLVADMYKLWKEECGLW